MKQKKSRGIETLKKRYGYGFIAPWVFGVVVFVLVPLGTSLYYAFSNVSMGPNGIQTAFTGIKHFNYLLMESPDYLNDLLGSLSSVFTALPIIMALSLILGIVLNQKFKGRLLARAVFFLPVIIASGVVMYVLNGYNSGENLTSSLGMAGASSGSYVNAIDFSDVLWRLNLPEDINNLLSDYLQNTFNLIWSCGVQTLLFIAGLQTIPQQLYEVGRVEGATAWETFWYITVPMLGRVILLVLFYTMVELFVEKSTLVDSALNSMRQGQIYDRSSAMLWLYFAAVGIVMGMIMLLYHHFCLKRWE